MFSALALGQLQAGIGHLIPIDVKDRNKISVTLRVIDPHVDGISFSLHTIKLFNKLILALIPIRQKPEPSRES